jgi:signal transduction histidine kinase
MESGRIDLNLSSIDLVELLSESIAELKPLAIDYGVRIIFDSNIKIPPVRLDKNKIQRVLNNLIDNALKFSPQDGEIKVTIELQNQEFVEIHVLDRGPGIPDKYIHSIFDRFFQIPDRPSRKRGSGLGLTYCRLAVEAHKGKIWVEQRPAGGSNFAISLPISVDQK